MAEEVDADEIRGGVRFTSSKAQPSPAYAPSSRAPPADRVRVEEGANTNVVALPLGELKDGVSVMTGDMVLCACGAAFSHISKIDAPDAGNNNNNNGAAVDATAASAMAGIWTCEFCSAANNVSVEKEEIPVASKVDYMLSGPTANAANATDAYTIIFVVDTSGSMCVTVPVAGGLRIKGGQRPSDEVLAFREGGAAQYLPNERQGEQYVSRLQCVVAAVEAQVDALRQSKPDVRVGLVTFASDVAIIGDGSSAPLVVTGDKLLNSDALLEAGAEFGELQPVSKSCATLVKSLAALEERGTTALGPGLCVAMGMLKGAPAGSKIVLLVRRSCMCVNVTVRLIFRRFADGRAGQSRLRIDGERRHSRGRLVLPHRCAAGQEQGRGVLRGGNQGLAVQDGGVGDAGGREWRRGGYC